MPRILALAVLAALTFAQDLMAHHGFGRFNPAVTIELDGTVTGIDFVNPHAYLYFDVTREDGSILAMRCEMRAATVLRRSGWSADMFVPGTHVSISGNPHQDDPASCYIETLALGGRPALKRYEQLSEGGADQQGVRPLRLASGELNISGDWAQEQYLMARPPGGGRGALVPKSMVEAVEAGDIAVSDVPSSGWGENPVRLTETGQAASAALRAAPPEDSPRARCEITSILFDWVFDGPVNRITQRGDTIALTYGRGLERTIFMNETAHPENLEPSRGGHSIGSWEGDTLVVDTVGFLPGLLAGRTVPNSGQLHVVERFSLNPDTLELKRDYVAEDPLYFEDGYVGVDTVLPADVPFAFDNCKDLTYVNYAEEAGE